MDFDYHTDLTAIDQHIVQIERDSCSDLPSIIYQIAKKIKPKRYLEIGVLKGRSMALVLKASPQTEACGIDIWGSHADYNMNPREVKASMKAIGIDNLPIFLTGSSYDVLPVLWKDKSIPEFFNLILVDGDHDRAAATKDLNLCLKHMTDDGILIFHDIAMPRFTHLRELIQSFKMKLKNYLFIESYEGLGFCLMTKRPFAEILNGLVI